MTSALFDVPAFVSVGEADSSSIDELSPLAPPEIPAGYERWVEKRRREYRAARHHARQALRLAGVHTPAVLRGEDGLPVFPEGTRGSITHTGRAVTFAAAAVCRAPHRIGIDAENHQHLDPMMVDSILLPHERQRYHERTAREVGAPRDIGLFALWVFSMKEAFYKCVYPRCAKVFGFLDVDVSIELPARRFDVTLRTNRYAGVPATLPGRYRVDEKRIVCGVTWKHADYGEERLDFERGASAAGSDGQPNGTWFVA